MKKRLTDFLGSPRLALVIVAALILFSLIGAIVPQQGTVDNMTIRLWQESHPLLSSAFLPLGFFRMFLSWPFIITIVLLAVNTAACTIKRLPAVRQIPTLPLAARSRALGILALHASLLLIMASGAISAATRFTGQTILTEGQTFIDRHEHYSRIAEGPLRGDAHSGFQVQLLDIRVEYGQNDYPLAIESDISMTASAETRDFTVSPNQPARFKGISVVQKDIGYSPRLVLKNADNGEILLTAFVALKTFGKGKEKTYRDFIITPSGLTLFMSCFPADNQIEFEMLGHDNLTTFKARADMHEEARIGPYSVSFTELRRWSALEFVDDPGYPFMCLSFLLGFISLLATYVPDLKKWFMKEQQNEV